jgi:hypothetical protein
MEECGEPVGEGNGAVGVIAGEAGEGISVTI